MSKTLPYEDMKSTTYITTEENKVILTIVYADGVVSKFGMNEDTARRVGISLQEAANFLKQREQGS